MEAHMHVTRPALCGQTAVRGTAARLKPLNLATPAEVETHFSLDGVGRSAGRAARNFFGACQSRAATEVLWLARQCGIDRGVRRTQMCHSVLVTSVAYHSTSPIFDQIS